MAALLAAGMGVSRADSKAAQWDAKKAGRRVFHLAVKLVASRAVTRAALMDAKREAKRVAAKVCLLADPWAAAKV